MLLLFFPLIASSQELQISELSNQVTDAVERAVRFDDGEEFIRIMAEKKDEDKKVKAFELNAITPLLVSNNASDIYGTSLTATVYEKVSVTARILNINPETASSFNQIFGSASYTYKSVPALTGTFSITDTENLHLTTKLNLKWSLPTFTVSGNNFYITPEVQYRNRDFDNAKTIRDWGGSLEMGFKFASKVSLSFQHSFADEISSDSSTLSVVAPWTISKTKITSVFSIDDSDQVTFVLSVPL